MKKSLIFFSILFVACTTNSKLQKEDLSSKSNDTIQINVVNKNNNIEFLIKNLNETPIYFVNTGKLRIERKNNTEWEKLRILPCPCDAPCRQNTQEIEITKGNDFGISWNMKESWCGTERVNSVRNTIKQTVEKGTYRIRITYKTKDNKSKIIYKEFAIQ